MNQIIIETSSQFIESIKRERDIDEEEKEHQN